MYEIILSDKAETQLMKTDNKTAKRILDKLVEASKNPKHYFERLSGRSEYKLRVGDWRVIVYISNIDNKILVISLGHRKKIYK